MRKKLILISICLILVLAVLPFMAACPAPPPAEEEAPVTLKYHAWMPETHPATQWFKWWADKVTEKSGGQVQFEYFYGGELGSAADQLKNIQAGLFDIGYLSVGKSPAELPLSSILLPPWVPSSKALARYYAILDLYELQCMKDELAQWDIKFVWPIAMGDICNLYLVDKPVYTLDDLKGLQIWATGRMCHALKLAGANPIECDPAENYEMLQKHICDAGCSSWAPSMSRGLQEVCKYLSTIEVGCGGPCVGMRLSLFNALPASSQKAIVDATRELGVYFSEGEAALIAKAKEQFAAGGLTIIEFPAAEQEKYNEIAAIPAMEKWISDMEAQGLPGRKVFETYRDAALKYEKTLE